MSFGSKNVAEELVDDYDESSEDDEGEDPNTDINKIGKSQVIKPGMKK